MLRTMPNKLEKFEHGLDKFGDRLETAEAWFHSALRVMLTLGAIAFMIFFVFALIFGAFTS